jgi:hypothetical protein
LVFILTREDENFIEWMSDSKDPGLYRGEKEDRSV